MTSGALHLGTIYVQKVPNVFLCMERVERAATQMIVFDDNDGDLWRRFALSECF